MEKHYETGPLVIITKVFGI